MKISFKHRSNLYLNCNRTSSVYRCNNVNVSYQHPTCASSQNQQLPTVTDQCMHIESYQNLTEVIQLNVTITSTSMKLTIL